MSRSLPQTAQAPIEEGAPTQIDTVAPSALTGTVEVFDPAMCCATGVCGPGVDPALLQIARDLRWLTAQGVQVTRVGLSQEPQLFVANPRVSGLLQAFGDQALPAVLVNGAVLAHGRYPGREELVGALTPSAPTHGTSAPTAPPPAAASAAAATIATAPTGAAPASRRSALQVVDVDEGGCAPGTGCC
jgi:hypothetical protein